MLTQVSGHRSPKSLNNLPRSDSYWWSGYSFPVFLASKDTVSTSSVQSVLIPLTLMIWISGVIQRYLETWKKTALTPKDKILCPVDVARFISVHSALSLFPKEQPFIVGREWWRKACTSSELRWALFFRLTALLEDWTTHFGWVWKVN